VQDQVYSLDVFSKTAWSSCPPTFEEYATMYDLPVKLQNFGWDQHVALPFVRSPLSKILMSFCESIIAGTEEMMQRPTPKPTPKEEPTVQVSAPRTQDHNNVKEGSSLSGSNVTLSGITVKASKADDAEVDHTWLWDVDMLANFPQLEKLSREYMKRICEVLCHGLAQG
jgi:hypothetical protein